MVKPLMFPAPPAFRTYRTSPLVVTLIGREPLDETVLISLRPSFVTAKDDIESLPALTAKRFRLLSLSTSAPSEPRPLPVPRSPVAKLPAAVSPPSADRLNT